MISNLLLISGFVLLLVNPGSDLKTTNNAVARMIYFLALPIFPCDFSLVGINIIYSKTLEMQGIEGPKTLSHCGQAGYQRSWPSLSFEAFCLLLVMVAQYCFDQSEFPHHFRKNDVRPRFYNFRLYFDLRISI